MIIGITKETYLGETRVAAVPKTVAEFTKKGFKILLQHNAGQAAGFDNHAYRQSGAFICSSAADILTQTDILLKIRAPNKSEISLLPNNRFIIGDLRNLTSEAVALLHKKNITAFALNKLPRLSLSQPFDILSSQDNLSGYQAVLKSLSLGKRATPLMITSAGTVPPLKFLIIGIGVAGLQAVATAKRLGAKVFTSDIRPETAEQAKSLGAEFVTDFTQLLSQTDIVITAAAGSPAPKIITNSMIKKLPAGAVLMDMAAAFGGNIVGSQNNTIRHISRKILCGCSDLATEIPNTASLLFANNLYNFAMQFYDSATMTFIPDNKNSLITSTKLPKG